MIIEELYKNKECFDTFQSQVNRWTGILKRNIEEITVEGLNIAEDYGCDIDYERFERESKLRIGCRGRDLQVVFRFPKYYEDSLDSLVKVSCSSPADCNAVGSILIDKDADDELGLSEKLRRELGFLGCKVEEDSYPFHKYIEFSCENLSSRDIDKVFEITSNTIKRQTVHVLRQWCYGELVLD